MTWLISLALKLGIPDRFAKLAVIAALLFGTLTILGIAKCSYDRNIVEKHDAKQEAATAKADRKADTKAAEQRRVDDSRSTAESTQIKEAIDEARHTGGDVRAAYYECVRKQQTARREHKPSPDC